MEEFIIDIICIIAGGLGGAVLMYLVANNKTQIATKALATAKEFMDEYGEQVKAWDENVYNKACAAITEMQADLEDGELTILEFAGDMTALARVFKALYSKFKPNDSEQADKTILD